MEVAQRVCAGVQSSAYGALSTLVVKGLAERCGPRGHTQWRVTPAGVEAARRRRVKRTRTADDKVLALLARMPAPLAITEIGAALAWTQQRARVVVLGLARAGQVVRIPEYHGGAVGRPSDAFALPRMVPQPGDPRARMLERDTVVITPSGEEARIMGMRGRHHHEVEYLTGPERFQRAVIHRTLLREIQPGRARPEPVRIAACGKAAA